MGLRQAAAHQRQAYELLDGARAKLTRYPPQSVTDEAHLDLEAAKVEALLALAEYVRIQIAPHAEVWNTYTIAKITGEPEEDVKAWTRQEGFPAPVTHDRFGPLYEWAEVQEWLGIMGWEPPPVEADERTMEEADDPDFVKDPDGNA